MGRPDEPLARSGLGEATPPWSEDATPSSRHQAPSGGGARSVPCLDPARQLGAQALTAAGVWAIQLPMCCRSPAGTWVTLVAWEAAIKSRQTPNLLAAPPSRAAHCPAPQRASAPSA